MALTISSAVVATGGPTVSAAMLSGEVAMPESVALAIGRAIKAGNLSYETLIKLSMKYPEVVGWILDVLAIETGTPRIGPLDPRAPVDVLAGDILDNIWDYLPLSITVRMRNQHKKKRQKLVGLLKKLRILEPGTYKWIDGQWVRQ